MKPEAAIEFLKKRVRYLAAKCKKPDYTEAMQDAVNTLIDFYNSQEEQKQQLHDLREDYDHLQSLYRQAVKRLQMLLNIRNGEFGYYAGIIERCEIDIEALQRMREKADDEQFFQDALIEQFRKKEEAIRKIQELFPGKFPTLQSINEAFYELRQITRE